MKRLGLVAVASVGLLACGPGAKLGGGKQGAAEALMAASQASLASSPGGGIDLTAGVSWACPMGGEAKLSGFSLSAGTGGVAQGFTLTYRDCALAKSGSYRAVFNGSMTVTQAVTTTATSVDVKQTFKGKLLVQGDFDDFIDADVAQTVTVADLKAQSGSITARTT